MIADEGAKAAVARIRQMLSSLHADGHVELLQTLLNPDDALLLATPLDDAIDFVLMDNLLEPRDERTRYVARLFPGLFAQYALEMYGIISHS